MNEQVKKYKESIKSFWKKQSKKRKTIILSCVAGVLIVSFIIAVLMNKTKFVVLYPNLDKDETIEVAQELEERNVEYKQENGTISVPEEQEESLRMDLSNSGHPRTSPNYDFFIDNVDMMTTSEERKIIEKYQLDQKLADVVKQIDGINDATVTITLPESNEYVLSDKKTEGASAGVTVTMTSKSKELSGTQAKGIKRLVASSVPSLEEDDVIIVDTATGNEISASEGPQKQLDMTQFKFLVESQFESDVSNNVLKVLNPLFGEDNVKIAVKSVIDIDKKIQEIVTYKPSENNKGVIKSENKTTEQQVDGSKEGGVVGTDSNVEDGATTYPGIKADGNTIYIKDEASYEYLVSSVKEQVQRDSGDLKDLTISVAVNTDVISEVKRIELSKLIANAAAVSPEKVVIYADRFADASVSDVPVDGESIFDKKPWLLYVIIGAAVLLVVCIVVLIVLKKKKKKKEEEALVSQESLNANVNVNEDTQVFDFDSEKLKEAQQINETKEQAMKKEIQEFSDTNPEIAAQLIRSWLKGDDPNG